MRRALLHERERMCVEPRFSASAGIPMGTGTDIAIEASDITLVKGNLKSVATALALSRATLLTIKQNLF